MGSRSKGGHARISGTPIDWLMRKRAISNNELSKIAQMQQSTISRIRAGINHPTRPIAARIVEALQTKLPYRLLVNDLWEEELLSERGGRRAS